MRLTKVIIHCQYVYGLGHLIRSLNLAKGLAKHFEVYFLNGGEAIKNFNIDESINFIQLPAIYKKEDSTSLLSVSDNLSLPLCLELRNQVIRKTVQMVKPDVIITEHFPFGFLFEKEATKLINYAKEINSNAKIVCSVRDVVDSFNGGNNDQKTISILNKLYDLLLIHGDEKLISIKSSFPLVSNIKIKVMYTGYIIDPNLQNNQKRSNNILVSIGGGRIGSELLEAVIKAFEVVKKESTCNLIVFNGAFHDDFKSISKDARIRYFDFDRKEFLNQLSQSDLSISLGGYNTTMESVYAGNKVVIYNREFLGTNDEQNIRISILKDKRLIDVISLKDLEIDNLSKKLISQVNVKNKQRSNSYIDFGGIENSVNQIKQFFDEE